MPRAVRLFFIFAEKLVHLFSLAAVRKLEKEKHNEKSCKNEHRQAFSPLLGFVSRAICAAQSAQM